MELVIGDPIVRGDVTDTFFVVVDYYLDDKGSLRVEGFKNTPDHRARLLSFIDVLQRMKKEECEDYWNVRGYNTWFDGNGNHGSCEQCWAWDCSFNDWLDHNDDLLREYREAIDDGLIVVPRNTQNDEKLYEMIKKIQPERTFEDYVLERHERHAAKNSQKVVGSDGFESWYLENVINAPEEPVKIKEEVQVEEEELETGFDVGNRNFGLPLFESLDSLDDDTRALYGQARMPYAFDRYSSLLGFKVFYISPEGVTHEVSVSQE